MEKEYKQLFVGGDLSGIQKFLYNITSRHASISLKGRSAFLSKYLRDVCDKIEDTILGCNGTFEELYCSGGKFYLITENTPAIISSLNDILSYDVKIENINNKYSNRMNYITLTKKLDNLVKYNPL